MQDEVIEIVRGVAELLLYGEARGDEKMFECFGHQNTLHIFLTLVSPLIKFECRPALCFSCGFEFRMTCVILLLLDCLAAYGAL